MVGNIGLHKGAGLGLLCELLGGALAGGTTMHPDSARRDRGGACTNNMMVICFTADRLGEGGTAAMMAEASRTLAYVKSSRPRPSENLYSQRGHSSFVGQNFYSTPIPTIMLADRVSRCYLAK